MQKMATCKVCQNEFPHNATGRPKTICSDDCRRKTDRDRKRAGVEIGGSIHCIDCKAVTIKIAPKTRRCAPCQTAWSAKRSARHRMRDPDRQRMLDTAAAARRRSSEEGAIAYREQCRAWRKVPKNRLRGRITAMMNRCLVSGKAGKPWFDLVDYSLDDLRRHIERQFVKGMSWDNMGEWHIDHIVPVAAFEFSSPEDAEFKACWSLSNLRPMWARENQRKSAKRIFLI